MTKKATSKDPEDLIKDAEGAYDTASAQAEIKRQQDIQNRKAKELSDATNAINRGISKNEFLDE